MIFGTDQDTSNNHPTPSGSDAPEEAADAQQAAGEDPAPTPEQPKRRKRTRAEIEAAIAAGEAPPRRRDRSKSTTPPIDEEPAAAPISDTCVNITLNPIDGKLTTDAINKVAADADPSSDGTSIRGTRHARVSIDEAAHFPSRELGSSDTIDFKAQAKARLKVYGKYATRAVEAAKLWPKEPTRYFDAVGKIFVDLTMGESRVDALRHDRHAVAELVISLLPKSTIELIDCSGITAL